MLQVRGLIIVYLSRIGQGPQVHPDEGRFPQRRLAPQELAQASPQALNGSSDQINSIFQEKTT
jgi:hypothetical protein